jgi:hypothetical protein
MEWLRRRVRAESQDADQTVDVASLLEVAREDPGTVQVATERIDRERRLLERRRASIDDQFHRMTPRQLKAAVRSRAAFPQLERNMLTDALQGVDAERERQRAEQLAAIDDRLKVLDDARRQVATIADD